MRLVVTVAVGPALVVIGLAGGCAHHRQDYAYAPPYAPPVYPQPPGPTIPGSYAPPVVTMPNAAGAMVPGPVVAGAAPATMADGQSPPCPPVAGATLVGSTPSAGAVAAVGTLISDTAVGETVVGATYVEGQSPPCPPSFTR